MRKEVVSLGSNPETDKEYMAMEAGLCIGDTPEFLASDSLTNIKKEIKLRGWKCAWITTSKGCFSYGQYLTDDYPYTPRYPRHRRQ